MGTVVTLPPLAREDVCQGYCITTATSGWRGCLGTVAGMSARGTVAPLPPLASGDACQDYRT